MKAAEPPKTGRIEVPSFWRCLCSYMTGVHRSHCDSCGRHTSETPVKTKAKK